MHAQCLNLGIFEMSCCKWDGCSKKKAFVCVAALGNGWKGCTYVSGSCILCESLFTYVSGYCILCESLFTSMLRYGGITGHGAHSLAFQLSKRVPLFTTQNLKITIKFCKDVNVSFSLQHYVCFYLCFKVDVPIFRVCCWLVMGQFWIMRQPLCTVSCLLLKTTPGPCPPKFDRGLQFL